MGRFKTEWLASEDNLKALTDLCGVRIDRVHDRKPPDGFALDIDSPVSRDGFPGGVSWDTVASNPAPGGISASG